MFLCLVTTMKSTKHLKMFPLIPWVVKVLKRTRPFFEMPSAAARILEPDSVPNPTHITTYIYPVIKGRSTCYHQRWSWFYYLFGWLVLLSIYCNRFRTAFSEFDCYQFLLPQECIPQPCPSPLICAHVWLSVHVSGLVIFKDIIWQITCVVFSCCEVFHLCLLKECH